MESDKSCHLRELQFLLNNDMNIKEELHLIDKQFNGLIDTITHLENENLLLSESIGLIDKIGSELKTVEDNYDLPVFIEFTRILQRNTGFEKIKQISKIISGETCELYTDNLILEEITAFNRAPITDVSNERSFFEI